MSVAWRTSRPALWLKRGIRRADDLATRLVRRVRPAPPLVLFEAFNGIGLEAQAPVIRELVSRGRVRVEVASGTMPCEQLAELLAPHLTLGARLVPASRARHRRYAVTVLTDRPAIRPWRTSRTAFLHHGSCHGNAAVPYPEKLFRAGDMAYVFCLSQDEVRQWVRSCGAEMRQRTVVTGQPKLDALVGGRFDRAAFLGALGLEPGRTTVLVSSHWSPTSLFRAGDLGALRDYFAVADVNLLVTAHPLLFEPGRVGGVEWSGRLRALFDGPRMRVLDGVPDKWAMLAAADVFVGDHSSMTLEFAVLERPLIVFRNPAYRFGDPEVEARLRATATVVAEVGALPSAVAAALCTGPIDPEPRRRLVDYSLGYLGASAARAAAAVEALACSGSVLVECPPAGETGERAGEVSA